MNKKHLVDKMALDAQLTRAQASRALESVLDGIRRSLVRGERVTLAGFGSFAVCQRKARSVRDPRRGATIRIAARRVARFAAGLELKFAIDRASEPEPTHAEEDYPLAPRAS